MKAMKSLCNDFIFQFESKSLFVHLYPDHLLRQKNQDLQSSGQKKIRYLLYANFILNTQ